MLQTGEMYLPTYLENITPPHASCSSLVSLLFYGPTSTTKEGTGSRTYITEHSICTLVVQQMAKQLTDLSLGTDKREKPQHTASFLAVMALIQSQGEKDRVEYKGEGSTGGSKAEERLWSLHGSGDAQQESKRRDTEIRLKIAVLSAGLQTPAAASMHGADGVLAIVQRTLLILAILEWS